MTTVTISLPDQIAKKVDTEAKSQGFATRSEFVRTVLRKYFSKQEDFEFKEFEPIPLEQLRLELTQTGKYNKKFIDSLIEGFRHSSIYENKAS